jgi:hypothetical protein
MDFKRHSDIALHAVGCEYFAMVGRDGSCCILNETAGWLLSIADDYVSVDQAVQRAVERYLAEPGDGVEIEIKQAMSDFQAKGLIEVRSTVELPA